MGACIIAENTRKSDMQSNILPLDEDKGVTPVEGSTPISINVNHPSVQEKTTAVNPTTTTTPNIQLTTTANANVNSINNNKTIQVTTPTANVNTCNEVPTATVNVDFGKIEGKTPVVNQSLTEKNNNIQTTVPTVSVNNVNVKPTDTVKVETGKVEESRDKTKKKKKDNDNDDIQFSSSSMNVRNVRPAPKVDKTSAGVGIKVGGEIGKKN
jgi:hypothetical protein